MVDPAFSNIFSDFLNISKKLGTKYGLTLLAQQLVLVLIVGVFLSSSRGGGIGGISSGWRGLGLFGEVVNVLEEKQLK